MEVLTVTAVFSTPEEALEALRHFNGKGVPDEPARVSAGCVLHVSIADTQLADITAELRKLGARDVTAALRKRDPGWMSHHSERVTGGGVMPGEGDAEAGT